MYPVEIERGDSPLVLGQPHGGTFVPDDVMSGLNDRGKGLDDTDWHITKLYDGLVNDITVVKATFHRYVIDANRDPIGQSLYPGQNTTTLCPMTDFDGNSILKVGNEPNESSILMRKSRFHEPYHNALQLELDRLKSIHGFVILYDCHSIRSNIPFLFDGELPIFNIGTNHGETCDSAIERIVTSCCKEAAQFAYVLNGRFKGGWTTRHYGQPENNIHAIQMELAQRCYMDEKAPWNYREEKAAQIRPYLKEILTALKAYRPMISLSS